MILIVLRILKDSFSQAFHQLRVNKLRTILSLLGITIGIFCIITVFSAVDSLERDIKESFERLGDDVVYISKMPWTEDPGDNYWKYLRRPNPDMRDYKALEKKLAKDGSLMSFSVFAGRKTIKFSSSHIDESYLIAVTEQYPSLTSMEFEDGRWLSNFEYNRGVDKVVIGHEIAKSIFGQLNPIGKYAKVGGRKLQIIGVLKKTGGDLINPMNFDWCCIVGFNLGKKMADLTRSDFWGGTLAVKAGPNTDLDELKDDVIVALRSRRKLKPTEENDFSINELSLLTGMLEQFFGILNAIGWLIGGFSLIVGAFSVANIMFVSVKERTSQIGIKKALGAKPIVILLEFLIESILLCILGGVFGLIMVFLLMKGLSAAVDNFTFVLSYWNTVFGLIIASAIGIISGAIPAFIAARMDPVVAIRS